MVEKRDLFSCRAAGSVILKAKSIVIQNIRTILFFYPEYLEKMQVRLDWKGYIIYG